MREQLERILQHREFQGSERTRRFLRYVVEEALAGRGERTKAFTVAMAAFDRDETFNAQSDPIVRIEAGRLRRCLERYYLVPVARGAAAGTVATSAVISGSVKLVKEAGPESIEGAANRTAEEVADTALR